jgi:hypothetical protein
MSLSSAGYPAVGYPSLHVFGGGTAKPSETRPVTPPSSKQTVFGSLPQWGVTGCNQRLVTMVNLGMRSAPIAASGRDQTTQLSGRLPETIGARSTDRVISRGLRSENLKRGERSGSTHDDHGPKGWNL